MKKLIDLSDDCVKYWAKEAIDNGSSFKPFVETFLENISFIHNNKKTINTKKTKDEKL